MRWFPVCCVTAVLAAPALAQVSDGQRLQEQLRRNRLETIDRVEASRKEAWEAFVASARKEGVFLDCRIAEPGPRALALYRGHVFLAGDGDALASQGRYGVKDGVASWWDPNERQWLLELDRWTLRGRTSSLDAGIGGDCTRRRGETAVITAPPPELPQVK